MASFHSTLRPIHTSFIAEQKLYFVSTAPADGRINLSPKGMDTFRCLDESTAAYLDLTGSGNETSAHLQEDGRITIMFCSFTEKPLILRIYGKGEVVQPGEEGWDDLAAHFELLPGTRQIFRIHVESVQTSCGYGIPFYELKGERSKLVDWAEEKGEEGVEEYRQQKNRVSIDGKETGLRVGVNG